MCIRGREPDGNGTARGGRKVAFQRPKQSQLINEQLVGLAHCVCLRRRKATGRETFLLYIQCLSLLLFTQQAPLTPRPLPACHFFLMNESDVKGPFDIKSFHFALTAPPVLHVSHPLERESCRRLYVYYSSKFSIEQFGVLVGHEFAKLLWKRERAMKRRERE